MTTEAHPSPDTPTNWNLDLRQDKGGVLLSSQPRAEKKKVSTSDTVQSNHPGGEGSTAHLRLQLGVEWDTERGKPPEVGPVSLSLLKGTQLW